MRGARLYLPLLIRAPGIIPADAGSTTIPGIATQWWQDHPRGCGEHG